MVKIFKFELPMAVSWFDSDWSHRVTVMMPAGAKILTIQTQRNQPMIWAEVDPFAEYVEMKLLIMTTGGEEFPGGEFKYIATFQVDEGGLVFHVYEEKKS